MSGTHMSPENALKLLRILGAKAIRMSQWERDFCYDVTHLIECGGMPSPRQYAQLKRMESRYFSS